MTDPHPEILCTICGEPLPPGEDMFKFHGYSGPCPKPPLPRKLTVQEKLLSACRIAHDAIARAETPGPHKLRDMQFVIDQLSGAIEAAGDYTPRVPLIANVHGIGPDTDGGPNPEYAGNAASINALTQAAAGLKFALSRGCPCTPGFTCAGHSALSVVEDELKSKDSDAWGCPDCGETGPTHRDVPHPRSPGSGSLDPSDIIAAPKDRKGNPLLLTRAEAERLVAESEPSEPMPGADVEAVMEFVRTRGKRGGLKAPADECRCGLPLNRSGPDDPDPHCSGCNMSASVCDCCPSLPRGSASIHGIGLDEGADSDVNRLRELVFRRDREIGRLRGLLRRADDVLRMLPPPASDCYTNTLQADMHDAVASEAAPTTDPMQRIVSNAKAILSHWDEFGPEHGLDEMMDVLRGNLRALDEAPVTRADLDAFDESSFKPSVLLGRCPCGCGAEFWGPSPTQITARPAETLGKTEESKQVRILVPQLNPLTAEGYDSSPPAAKTPGGDAACADSATPSCPQESPNVPNSSGGPVPPVSPPTGEGGVA